MTDAVVLAGPGEANIPVILLVEDEVLVRLLAAEMLRDAGYQVLEAVDAAEALAIVATGHPLDLVFTDIRMPGKMDGIELASTIKTLRANLPVVLLSSHLPDGEPPKADRFIAKPYFAEDLVQAAEELIGNEWLTHRTTPSAC